MGNVIKYGTHVVLCLVVAVVFAMRIRRNKYRLPMDLKVVSFTLAVKNHRSYTLENTVEHR